MRRRAALALLALALTAAPLARTVAPALASEWGEIAPGTTRMPDVRARYGAPTRTTRQKVDTFDTMEWVYQGAQAPVGTRRMTVDFGLLTPGGYRPDLVRDFRLELMPGAFNRGTIISGWGIPSRTSLPGRLPHTFIYDSGLVVTFDDQNGWDAQTMLFTPPQPRPGAAAKRP